MRAANARPDQKTPAVVVGRVPKSAALYSLKLYISAPQTPHECSYEPRETPTKFSRRVSRGTPCLKAALVDPHIAATRPRTFVRASTRRPSRQQKQRLRSAPAGEHAEKRDRPTNRGRTQVSRKNNTQLIHASETRCVRSSPQWASPSTGASACSSPRRARGGSLR